jgi:hypothetical protein
VVRVCALPRGLQLDVTGQEFIYEHRIVGSTDAAFEQRLALGDHVAVSGLPRAGEEILKWPAQLVLRLTGS